MSFRNPSERALMPLHPSKTLAPISSDTHHASASPPRRQRVACRECRQAKLKCNTHGTGSPCSRCRRLSISCEIDTSYKRVNKRPRIDELAEEVERLRSTFNQRESDSSRFGTGSFSSSHANTSHQHLGRAPQQDSSAIIEPPATPLFQNTPGPLSASLPTNQPRCLEDVNLEKDQINDLFRIFFEHYHTFFDILDSTISPDEFYSRSKFLFWSIITIASRHYTQDTTLFSILKPCITRMMWTSISNLPHTRFTIQAILLLSVWSFPVNSMSTDPSFILVSIAKSASLQLGLHKPEDMQDFLRVKTRLSSLEFQCAVKTWVGGFIAAQSVTASIGQWTLLHPDWVIESACEIDSKYAIPENLRHHLLISKFITRINSLMAENKRSETGYPMDGDICILMNLLEQDFTDLELHIGRNLSENHQILLEMSALQLRTYYFFISADHDMRRRGLLKAYTTSLNLISKAIEATGKSDFMRYAPDGYGQFLSYIDVDEGKRAFDALLEMYKRASIEKHDLRDRFCRILPQLWGFHQSRAAKGVLEEPKLNIKTRLGASLMHDSFWTWREEFGGQKGDARCSAPYLQSSSGTLQNFPAVTRNLSPELETADPQTETQQDLSAAVPATFEETDFEFLAEDMNWLWDVGFPSFLPSDFSS